MRAQYIRGPIADRFWPKVDRSAGPGGCWPWIAHIRANGYGWFSVATSTGALAHRVAYELYIGPIPDGLTIDHLCQNTACCNPAHMEPVTLAENVRRADYSANGADHRAKTHCPQGHPYAGSNLYLTSAGRACRRCRADAVARYRARHNGH